MGPHLSMGPHSQSIRIRDPLLPSDGQRANVVCFTKLTAPVVLSRTSAEAVLPTLTLRRCQPRPCRWRPARSNPSRTVWWSQP